MWTAWTENQVLLTSSSHFIRKLLRKHRVFKVSQWRRCLRHFRCLAAIPRWVGCQLGLQLRWGFVGWHRALQLQERGQDKELLQLPGSKQVDTLADKLVGKLVGKRAGKLDGRRRRGDKWVDKRVGCDGSKLVVELVGLSCIDKPARDKKLKCHLSNS